ncbi:NAD(P)H-binding protein [Actinoplanes sp. N902-109]|uniref:NAD(P)H-binding protein n=1 Tax=Actinoplanes sp. (strain N902-109) TaxID=649831 RepID=UPI0005A1C0BE|nr:NAD(P)H-binding protein [Actinoplanes sp. N902-109]
MTWLLSALPLSAPEKMPSGPRVVRADIRDAASLTEAFDGCDAVGPAGRTAGDLYSDGARAVVAAMPRAGGLDRTPVRPTYLQDRAAAGAYRIGDGGGPVRGWRISRADLAGFVVGDLEQRRRLHRTPSLAD